MPGLIQGLARAAVIAGKATGVSDLVSRRHGGRWWARQDQPHQCRDEPQQQQGEQAPAGSSLDDRLALLRQLGDLKAQGVLSEGEFEQQTSQILNS
jgi:hypothetical protein